MAKQQRSKKTTRNDAKGKKKQLNGKRNMHQHLPL
jgi:hypothetical protein